MRLADIPPNFGYCIAVIKGNRETRQIEPVLVVGPFRTEQEACDYLAEFDDSGIVVPLKMAVPMEVLLRDPAMKGKK